MGFRPASWRRKATARSGPGTPTRTKTTATRIAGWRSLSSSEGRRKVPLPAICGAEESGMSRWRHNRMIVAVLAAALTFAGCAGGSSRSSGPQRLDPGGGANGPGMKPQEAATLQLPVPRTFDLTHVQPAHLAAALGNDPVRLFSFVRDAIGYEAYSGLLRGPRGTLLAMAGNSVDRALLLGTMLAHAGQRIRYARGTLSGDQATTLVTSMWIDRGKGQAAQNAGSRSPAIRAVLDGIMPALDRYSALIRAHLTPRVH